MTDLTAAEVARFDQDYAMSVELLTDLIQAYMMARCEDVELGVTEPVSIMEFAAAIMAGMPAALTVSALTAAIVLLAEGMCPGA